MVKESARYPPTWYQPSATMYTLPRTFLFPGGRNGIFADSLGKVNSSHTSLQNGPRDTTHMVLPHVESRLACVTNRTVRQMELWLCRLGHRWHCGFHLLLRVAWSGCQDTEQAPGEDYMERSQDLLPLSSTNMSVLWVVILLADPFVFRWLPRWLPFLEGLLQV